MEKKYDYFDNQLEAKRWSLRAKVINLTKLVDKLEEAEKDHDILHLDKEYCEINGSLVRFIDYINAVIAKNEKEIMDLDNEIKKGGK